MYEIIYIFVSIETSQLWLSVYSPMRAVMTPKNSRIMEI